MASYIGSDQELVCQICACCYSTPRKLKGCVHSFCERCILTLIQNLKKDEKLGDEFECPVCRLPSKSPEIYTTSLSEWVQTLDIDKELQTKVEKQNEQDSKWCSQCRYVDKFIKSEIYCSTCQDSFCRKCSETLHSFKMNTNHAIIDIKADSENETIGEQAMQLLQTCLSCSNHSEKSVEFCCQDEDLFGCVRCIANEHKGCKNVFSLKELVEKDAESGCDENNAIKLLGSISELNEHIKSIVNLIKEKDAESKKAPEKLALQFQGIKQKVIHLLDAVEEQITQDSKALTKAISIKNLDEIELLNAIMSETDVVTYLLDTLVPKLPSDSALVCCKNVKVILKSLERKVLERGSSFETEELELKIEEEFNLMINLGPNDTKDIISVESNRKSYSLPRLNEKFLLRDGKVEKVSEENCLSEICPGENPQYNNITYLPDHKLLLTDSLYGICLLVDTNLEPIDSANFMLNEVAEKSKIDSNLICASYFTKGFIAISIYNEKKICFMMTGNGFEKKGEIICRFSPSAIHGLRNGDICVLWRHPQAVGIITLCNGSYSDKVYFDSDSEGRLIKHRNRLAVDEDRQHIIVSSLTGHKDNKTVIVAYDFEGHRVFEYSHTELKDFRGIALDADGNIYILEHALGQICVLSPDGLLVKIIQEGCPSHPLGIGFNKGDNTFAVTQKYPYSQKLVFFSITPP